MDHYVTQVKQQSGRALVAINRWSYVSKAFLYCSAGILAIRSAIGLGGAQPDRKKVLETLFAQPLGQVMIAVIVITLAAHTLWRLFEIVKDPYRKGSGVYGIVYRFTYFLSGLSYGSLAYSGVKLLFGKDEGAGEGKRIWVAQVLHFEGGNWLIASVGMIMLLWAGVQAYKGVSGKLAKSLKTDRLGSGWQVLIYMGFLIGFLTLAGILGGVGYYFLKAAFTRNANYVKSMDDLLQLLLSLPHGLTWLMTVATGLIILGVLMLLMARYFPFKLEKEQ